MPSTAEARPDPRSSPPPVSAATAAAARRAWVTGLWWISPAGAVALAVPASLAVAATLADSDYRLQWRTPKALTDTTVGLIAAAALVLVLGCLIAQLRGRKVSSTTWPGLSAARVDQLEKAANIIFWLTALGYLAFAAAGAARGVTPGVLVQALVSQENYSSTLKESFAPIPGLTTLTQCGIAYVIVAGLVLAHRPNAQVRRRLAIVLVLALVRAFINTERLAFLELAVPLVAVAALHLRRGSNFRARAVVAAPLLLIPLVVAVFGAFEYSRSWQFFESRTSQSFPAFVLTRIAGYYATAYNNGQLRLDYATYAGRAPYESVQMVWDAPGIAQLGLYEKISATRPSTSLDILEKHGNPEFNNPGGLTAPFVDFGMVGGFAFFLVAGLMIGALYRSFTEARIIGLLFYPLALTGLFELPRYLYWSQGRVLPALLALAAVAYALRRSPPRRSPRLAR